MRLSPGEKLGPYEILAQVGEGGMGAVYKARDTRLNRTVAIKVSNEEFSERFEREAHAVASLNHPNICTLHDVGPNYLVMEFIEGKPLQGPLPAEKAIACAIQIVEALDAAHRKGITHRDLKPGNILVTKQGVKLLDFGLAKSLSSARPAGDATLTQALTEKGIVLGTVPYMSPEQIQGEPADARSDIFSFGIVFYELLTGRRPFEGMSQANLMAAILEHEPPPVEGVPPALDLLIRHCLAKDPDARWQSAHDLALELRSLQDRTPEQTAKVRHPIPWIAAAAVLGLAAAWGWYAALRNPPEEREPRHFELYPPPGTQFITPRDGLSSLAVSPDGRSIVFGAERNRQRSLWLHSLVTNESKEMEGSEGGFGPFWSPDSRQIAFVAEERLQLYSLDGGRPVSLAPTGNRFFGGYWSPEGPIIFSSASGGFQSVSPEGGDPKTILKPDAAKDEIFYAHPQAHADGRSFVFTVIAKRYDESFFGIASLSQPVRRTALPRVPSVLATRYVFDRSNSYFLHVRNQRIFAQKVDPGSLAPATEAVAIAGPTEAANFRGFCPIAVASDKVLVYFGPDFQEGQLTWYSRDGREMGTVGSPASYFAPEISPDANRVAVARALLNRTQSQDIWVFDLTRDATTRLTSTPEWEGTPVWSHDGRSVFFRRATGTFRAPSGGGPATRLPASELGSHPSWALSARNQYAIFPNRANGGIWCQPMDGSTAPFLVAPTQRMPRDAQFSPDERWIAYTADDSGADEVYVVPFTGKAVAPDQFSNRTQVSTAGGSQPRWRANSRELYYVSPDNELMAVEIPPIPQTAGGDRMAASTPKRLFRLPALLLASAVHQYAATANGDRFLVAKATNSTMRLPIHIILNWTALLNKPKR